LWDIPRSFPVQSLKTLGSFVFELHCGHTDTHPQTHTHRHTHRHTPTDTHPQTNRRRQTHYSCDSLHMNNYAEQMYIKHKAVIAINYLLCDKVCIRCGLLQCPPPRLVYARIWNSYSCSGSRPSITIHGSDVLVVQSSM